MADRMPQTFANHARFVPLFHLVAVPILVVNFVNAIVVAARAPQWSTILGALVAMAIMIVAFAARVFATTVQDRIIRYEERERLERLLPADLRNRIHDFTRRQLVAMRFAPDEELPSLARTVLEKEIASQKEIKQMIIQWRADHLRA